MLSLYIAATVLSRPAPETAAELVGRMLRVYDAAQSMTGTIRLTQSVQNYSITIDTTLQFQRPSKLYIRQDRKSSEPRSFVVTSDGRQFSYDLPEGRVGVPGERLFEAVTQGNHQLGYREIYAACSRSLGDRSTPLDIAIARTEDLKYVRAQWAEVEFVDKDAPEGVKIIGGGWRLYPSGPVNAYYEMWIEESSGFLKKFVHKETIQPDATVLDERFRVKRVDLQVGPITIVSTWDVDLKVDGKPDESLFKVLK